MKGFSYELYLNMECFIYVHVHFYMNYAGMLSMFCICVFFFSWSFIGSWTVWVGLFVHFNCFVKLHGHSILFMKLVFNLFDSLKIIRSLRMNTPFHENPLFTTLLQCGRHVINNTLMISIYSNIIVRDGNLWYDY